MIASAKGELPLVESYYYIRNLQGDIVKIVNSSGETVVSYTYDVWGKVLSQRDTSGRDLANLNPFRYRGYVYDAETGEIVKKSAVDKLTKFESVRIFVAEVERSGM